MYYRLYTVLGWLLIIAAIPFFVSYCLLSGRSIASLRQRLGLFIPAYAWQHQKRLWFHAASVGEVQAAKALITVLLQTGIEADIIVSTVTEQGQLAARRQMGDAALCLYAPFDLPWVIERFLERLKPTVYICLETELWPNILRLAHARGVRSLLLNGRLSESAFRNYVKIKGFIAQVLRCFNGASVIRAIDRDRYLALGLDPGKVVVNGNAKYDLRIESLLPLRNGRPLSSDATLRESVTRQYQEILGVERQPVLLAGSTHTGEEEALLAAYKTLVATIEDLVLIIAPRHLDRLDQLQAEWRDKDIPFQTYSQVVNGQRTCRIIVVDRMGELASLYAVATYVFCGGSLASRGGHNIMEPAIWGKPPFYGPHMNDFADARALLEEREAGFTVASVHELIDKILYFHHHPDKYQQAAERALAVALAQQGAAINQVEMIRQALG